VIERLGREMTRILLTGMSGTGKSTVIEELAARGYRAADIDQPGWSVHAPDGDWIWNEPRVQKLLSDANDDLLFISGCAENQGKFYEFLDAVVLLSAPQDVMVERLQSRTNNSYGKSPEELDEVLHYRETVEPLIRSGATHEIDTNQPLRAFVERVLEISSEHDLE
jgi:shikimate kinase